MKFKLLVLDLDDTLLNDDLEIPQVNIDAVKAIEAQGCHVVLCSGRPLASMLKYVDTLDIHSDEDYIVSYNGAIIDKVDGTRVHFTPIEGEALEELIDIGRKAGIDVQLYTEELTVEKHTERTKLYETLTSLPSRVVPDLKEIKESVKVLFNHEAGAELEALRLEVVEKYSSIFNVFYSKPFYVEVLNKKASKGLAVKYLAEDLGIKQEEIIAIGDGFNDVSMLQYAGIGVAVNNAPDGVKEAADIVAKRTNNEGVVEEIYNKYFK